MNGVVVVPQPQQAEGFVECAAPLTVAPGKKIMGRVFRKHILTMGNLIHPKTGQNLTLDEKWYDQLKGNFDSGVADIVAVPLANDKNEHVEDPLRNIGECVGLEREGSKVYAFLDIRDKDAADKMGKTLLGASAFMHLDYTNTKSGQKSGAALLHCAVTNRPYVTNLEPYEEILSASATEGEEPGELVVLVAADPNAVTPSPPVADKAGDDRDQEEPVPLSREELLAALRDGHGIDVEALQAAAAAPPATDAVTLSEALVEALKSAGVVQLTGGAETVSAADLTAAVVELAQTAKTQGDEIGVLKLTQAETEVDSFISAGRLLPKARGKAVELMLSGDRDGLDAFLAPEGSPYVKLDNVTGTAGDEGQQQQDADIDGEMARLAAAHPEYFDGGRK